MKRIKIKGTNAELTFPDNATDDQIRQEISKFMRYSAEGIPQRSQYMNHPVQPKAIGEDRYADSFGSQVARQLTDLGMSKYSAEDYGAAAGLAGEMIPGIGDVQGWQDFQQAVNSGDHINAYLAAMSMIPVVGAASSKMIKGGGKIIGDVFDKNKLPDVPEVNVNIARPADITTASRNSNSGQYYGAPRGVASPQKLGRMRTDLYGMLEEGIPGRDWYDNSSQITGELTADRPGLGQRYSLMNSLTSQGASVPANQAFGFRGYNQQLVGDEVSTGRFPSAVRRVTDNLDQGEANLGQKVGAFYEGVTVKPGEQASRPTNDLWMARAFGYVRPDGKAWDGGLSEAQHRFMDKEINEIVVKANKNKLGGFDDWTPEKVQASIWTSIKARTEGTTIEKSAYDFSSDLDNFTANINVESEPALGLNHLPGLRGDIDAMDSLHAGQQKALSDEKGRDLISLYSGGLTRPTETGFGYYKGYSAPADVVQTMVAPGTGVMSMDAASDKLTKGIAATHGLIRGQESVGTNFFKKGGRVIERNAADVNVGRALSRKEMVRLGGVVDDVFEGNVFPVNTKNGVRFLTDPDGLKDWAKARGIEGDQSVAKEWQKELAAVVKSELNTKPSWGVTSGDLVGSFEEYTPSAYLKAIEESGVEPWLGMAAKELSGKLDDVDKALVKRFPNAGERSETLSMVRQALSSEGLSGVRKLVDKGLVPAFVVGILVHDLADQQSDQRQRGKEQS